MKAGEENVPPRILGQSKAIYCFVINQLATPGLGSLIGKRAIPGAGQLALALAGFVMLLDWIVHYFYGVIQTEMGEAVTQKPYGWLGKWGAICFAASWVWALVTSISLIRQARREAALQQRVPPTPPVPPLIQ